MLVKRAKDVYISIKLDEYQAQKRPAGNNKHLFKSVSESKSDLGDRFSELELNSNTMGQKISL